MKMVELYQAYVEALKNEDVELDTPVLLWNNGDPREFYLIWTCDQDEDGNDIPGSMKAYLHEDD